MLENTLREEQPVVRILINAAGFGKTGPVAEIAAADRKVQTDMIDVNCRALTDITEKMCIRDSFNIIGPSVYDSVFLDLFSGSGGIGIEALSRGAREAFFVEKNPKAMACIRENLKFTRLESRAVTITRDVMDALYRLCLLYTSRCV